MKWAVEIQRTSLEKRNLSDLLLGLGFNLVEGIEYPAIWSPGIDESLTATVVFEKAKAVRAAFNGPAQIDLEFALGSVIDYSTNPPRRHAFLEAEPCTMRLSVSSVTLTMSPPKSMSLTELERWTLDYEERQYQAKLERQRSMLEPAYFSADAAKVMELLSVEAPSGEIVYKIYELAEGHPDNRVKFQQQFGISRDQFARFRDAVHNPAATGDWARHAYHREPQTSNPMTKSEAEDFVRDISSKWLESLRRPNTQSGR